MDKEFIRQFESISEWKEVDKKSDCAGFSASFSEDEDGVIRISSDKGDLVYKLKQLDELFSTGEDETQEINWEDQHYMPLLYCIERAIKNTYKGSPELTDSSVIFASRSCL